MGGHLAEMVAAMEAIAGGANLNVETITCDITDEQQVRQAAARVGQLFSGRLDVLVNNAGVNGKCTRLSRYLGRSGFSNRALTWSGVWCLVCLSRTWSRGISNTPCA